MQPQLVRSMHEQVRAIYRAITGEDVRDDVELDADPPDTDDAITRRFAELAARARALPSVMERVPPFTFTPPIDVVAADGEVVLELALPAVDRDDISIEHTDGALRISGIRRDDAAARGDRFHAEIPRGPFCRVVPLPFAIAGEPRAELDRGVLRVHLPIAATTGRGDSTRDTNPVATETGQEPGR